MKICLGACTHTYTIHTHFSPCCHLTHCRKQANRYISSKNAACCKTPFKSSVCGEWVPQRKCRRPASSLLDSGCFTHSKNPSRCQNKCGGLNFHEKSEPLSRAQTLQPMPSPAGPENVLTADSGTAGHIKAQTRFSPHRYALAWCRPSHLCRTRLLLPESCARARGFLVVEK